MRRLLPAALALLAPACAPDKPFPFEQTNLQVKAVFPGEPRQAVYPEDTPFGRIQWTTFSYFPGGRMDLSFHLDVGNLPPGDRGGDTVPAALATFERYLGTRLRGPVVRTDLPASRGPGFQYVAPGMGELRVEGVVILKRGRLHHAQATVRKADDPRLRAFLDSFAVQ